MWVTKLLISPVKKGFFAQKPPNLAWIWHFWPLLAHSVPYWWVGWWLWRAGCISQDTYLLYYFDKKQLSRSLPYRLPILILPTFEEWVCKKDDKWQIEEWKSKQMIDYMAGRISETSTRSRLLWTRRRKNRRKKTMTASADRGRKKKWRKTLLNVSMMMVLDVDDGDGFFPL